MGDGMRRSGEEWNEEEKKMRRANTVGKFGS